MEPVRFILCPSWGSTATAAAYSDETSLDANSSGPDVIRTANLSHNVSARFRARVIRGAGFSWLETMPDLQTRHETHTSIEVAEVSAGFGSPEIA